MMSIDDSFDSKINFVFIYFMFSMSTLNREGIEGGSPQTPLTATAPIPTSSMKIFMSDTSNELVAENVKIGDKLSLSITIGEQGLYNNCFNMYILIYFGYQH